MFFFLFGKTFYFNLADIFPDVDVTHPDEKSIITYVSSLYDAMPRALDAHDGVRISVSFMSIHAFNGMNEFCSFRNDCLSPEL